MGEDEVLWRQPDESCGAVELTDRGLTLLDGGKTSPLCALTKETPTEIEEVCFYPSEARSLAAALTAWANRVDPPKRSDLVAGEDRMFQAIDPTDVKESVEVNRTNGLTPFLVTVRVGSDVSMCGLTAEKAAELAAFLTRKPAGKAVAPALDTSACDLRLSGVQVASDLVDVRQRLERLETWRASTDAYLIREGNRLADFEAWIKRVRSS